LVKQEDDVEKRTRQTDSEPRLEAAADEASRAAADSWVVMARLLELPALDDIGGASTAKRALEELMEICMLSLYSVHAHRHRPPPPPRPLAACAMGYSL
jgi:hypothetical protein